MFHPKLEKENPREKILFIGEFTHSNTRYDLYIKHFELNPFDVSIVAKYYWARTYRYYCPEISYHAYLENTAWNEVLGPMKNQYGGRIRILNKKILEDD